MKLSAGPRPKKGDRYVVATEFEAIALTMWRAPFTGGSDRKLPRGLQLVIDMDPPDGATAAVASPGSYAEWEHLLVDEADWTAEKYSGYYLSIPFEHLEENCSKLSPPQLPR